MSLLDDVKNDKETLIALDMAVKDMAADMGLSTEDLDNLAREHSSQVDELLTQVEKALGAIELPGPCAPTCQPDSEATVAKEWRLREQTLRFRLQHPDALVQYPDGRVAYSDGFIRFILERLDAWEYGHERFCEQVEVPCQTLRTWIKEDGRR
jgi:hypothetical protein